MIPLDIPRAATDIVFMSDVPDETLPAPLRPKVEWDSAAWPKAQYLTTAEAANLLGLQPRRVRQLIEAGTLSAERWGRDHLIPRNALEQFVKSRRQA